jgi:hypothetical protein
MIPALRARNWSRTVPSFACTLLLVVQASTLRSLSWMVCAEAKPRCINTIPQPARWDAEWQAAMLVARLWSRLAIGLGSARFAFVVW